MTEEENVPLSIHITLEARKILEREACKLVYGEDDRLPLGRVVTAMTLWFEDNLKWNDIRDEIRAAFAREAQERRVRDRERKRAAKRRT
jgi:hypothetical protein